MFYAQVTKYIKLELTMKILHGIISDRDPAMAAERQIVSNINYRSSRTELCSMPFCYTSTIYFLGYCLFHIPEEFCSENFMSHHKNIILSRTVRMIILQNKFTAFQTKFGTKIPSGQAIA